MASTGCSAFSPDGQYWAFCGRDGKLKIWETSTSRLKQEFVPNLHLSSPCSVLEWMTVGQQSINTTPSPWKKRKRKSIIEDVERKQTIAMGSVNGSVTLYDLATALVNKVLENGHSGAVTAITWSSSAGLFTAAADNQIVEWNIQDNGIKCKWKSGKSKITALAVLPDGQTILSADRLIKWWDLKTKQVLGTFTGHANPIIFLRPVNVDANTCYLISGASGDSYLSVWSLADASKCKTSIAALIMQDEPASVSIQVNENSQLTILSVNKSGQAHFFMYQPNGICAKPLKPSVTIFIASESGQKEGIQQIPIQSAYLTEDNKMLLAYSSLVTLTFEKVEPDFSDKVQALVRSDVKWTKERKDEAVSKVRAVETEGNVEYLSPGATNVTGKRTRSGVGSQLPLKDRLENLSLNAETNTSGRTPTKGANMAQLLMQGLNSKDKNILMNVLQNKDETIIKNTIAKLPVQAIPSLLRELTAMLQGKTFISKVALSWLKTLILTHTAHLLSLPDIGDALSPILGLIDAKLMILSELSRLRGRVALVTGQISHLSEKQNDDMTEECLLVYQDPDSSDDGTDVGEMEAESESDENWDEISDREEEEEEEEVHEDMENGRSDDDDNASMCS